MKRSIPFIAVAVSIVAFACNAEEKPKTVKSEPMQDLTKLSKEELAKHLDPEAYNVCIMGGTERPFQNKYWNNHEQGLYVDVASGPQRGGAKSSSWMLSGSRNTSTDP